MSGLNTLAVSGGTKAAGKTARLRVTLTFYRGGVLLVLVSVMSSEAETSLIISEK
jgi:hypothetical protein